MSKKIKRGRPKTMAEVKRITITIEAKLWRKLYARAYNSSLTVSEVCRQALHESV